MEKIVKLFENPSLSTKRNNILNEYRKIDKFTDLTLKSTDGKTMKVHKNILSASCGYFEAMFNSELVETRQELIQLVDDLTIADLEILIEYIYTGKTEVSLENAENIFIKAQYIQLIELQEFCSEFIIENITIENCLNYWRKSIKYFNHKLAVECPKFIRLHCKSFLENNVWDNITAEELKLILTVEEILVNDQDDWYKIVAKWIKVDFESRKLHLIELMGYLDFMKLSDNFVHTEIMCDEILQSNREFARKITNITCQKYQELKQKLEEEKEKSLYCESLKNIYLITNDGIYKNNWSEWAWKKQFTFKNTHYKSFATSVFNDEIFISGGRLKSETCSTNFKSWNISSRKIKELPAMIESRTYHKLVVFEGKIYSCGGCNNNGSTELFDFEKCKWIKGATMNKNRMGFGLVTANNSIYAFGGLENLNVRIPTSIVEQFDPREGKWKIISTESPELYYAAILSNSSVYCFDKIYGGQRFDLRTNTWTNSLANVFEKKEGLSYHYDCCDIVEFNDEIFGLYQTEDDKTWGTFQYDRNSNKWNNLNIPLHLNQNDSIRLCCTSKS